MTKQFDFNNKAVNLTPLTQQMLNYITLHLPDDVQRDTVMFKAKFILTELLTNSLKHSGAADAQITVNLTGNLLQITKTDAGKPLPLIAKSIADPGTKVSLSQDVMHQLYAIWGPNGTITFICEEKEPGNLDIYHIGEHFGLLIITKTADEFTYHYEGSINTFTATINLN